MLWKSIIGGLVFSCCSCQHWFWLIKRNRKDEKEWEKEVIQSEIKPEDRDNDEPGLKT